MQARCVKLLDMIWKIIREEMELLVTDCNQLDELWSLDAEQQGMDSSAPEAQVRKGSAFAVHHQANWQNAI